MATVISTILLTAIILPLTLALLLSIEGIQNFVVRQATTFLSDFLGTTVSIDHIAIRSFDKVVAKGVYVADLQGDTLLYASELKADLNKIKLLSGQLALNSCSLDGAQIDIHNVAEGGLNLTQLLDKFKKSDNQKESKPFTIGRATISDTQIKFATTERKPVAGRFDAENINLYIDRLSLNDLSAGQTTSLTLDFFAARESCGLVIERMSAGRIYVEKGDVEVENFELESGATDLRFKTITMEGPLQNGFANMADSVQLRLESLHSSFDTSILSYFVTTSNLPKLKVEQIDINAHGTLSNLDLTFGAAQGKGHNRLIAEARIKGLPDTNNCSIDLHNLLLSTSAQGVEALTNALNTKLPTNTMAIIRNAGQIELSGSANGTLASMKGTALLSTAVGNAQLGLVTHQKAKQPRTVECNMTAFDFDAGGLLGNKSVGRLSLSMFADALLRKNDNTINAQATLSSATVNNYTYHNITIEGHIEGKDFSAQVVSNDPNAKASIEAVLSNSSDRRLNVKADVEHLDLFATQLNKSDSTSVLTCRLNGSTNGTTLDDMVGKATITELTYRTSTDTLSTGKIVLWGENTQQLKQLTLNSSFADAEFSSPMSYKRIYSYLREIVSQYIPSVIVDSDATAGKQTETVKSDDSVFKLHVKSANNVAGTLVKGLQIANNTELSFRFNPDREQFRLNVNVPYVEYGRNLATNLHIATNNAADSLIVSLETDDCYLSGFNIKTLSLNGGAKKDNAQLVLACANNEKGLSARIDAKARFGNDSRNNKAVCLTMGNSYVVDNDFRWNITTDSIVYSSEYVDVKNFAIANTRQSLVVDGKLSENLRDSLTLRINKFDLDLLQPLINKSGYTVAGELNGYANIRKQNKSQYIAAEFTIDSLSANGFTANPLLFTSSLDFARERITMRLSNRLNDHTLAKAYFRPHDKALLADVTIDQLPLGLLDPVLTGVIEQTTGTTSTNMEILVSDNKVVMNGVAEVNDLHTTVEYTRSSYIVPKAVMEFKESRGTIAPVEIDDLQGNKGSFELMLDLSSFSNIKYEVNVRPENMLVLNTTIADNPLFYGHVFATGSGVIKGEKGRTDMIIAASTAGNSSFSMPLSGNDDVKSSEFISYTSATPRPDTTDVLLRKKLVYERQMNPRRSSSKMNISMNLTVRPNTEFQLVVDPRYDNVLKARGNASLNLNINPRNNIFTMYGAYDLTEGSYLFNFQNLLERQFQLMPGSTITWTGDPVDAALNISAVYKLKTSLAPLIGVNDRSTRSNTPVECFINITDRLTKPNITFDVNVPNADSEYQSLVQSAFSTQEMTSMQFLYLIAFGTFYADSNAGTNLNIGATATSAIGMEILTSQLSNLLSSDDLEFNIRYTPHTTDNVTTEEVGIDVQKEIISNKLILELEGNYDTSNTSSSTSRVSGGGSLTYVIDNAGNLVSKFYSRTIDRFDENQGLQENGVGIYYRHDFNTFREMIENGRKKREERREARTIKKREKQKTEQTD